MNFRHACWRLLVLPFSSKHTSKGLELGSHWFVSLTLG